MSTVLIYLIDNYAKYSNGPNWTKTDWFRQEYTFIDKIRWEQTNLDNNGLIYRRIDKLGQK